MLFVIVGFGFKISAVPFHFWAPDTYEGAPVPVTAFLSVASKAAGFAGLLQVCFVAFEPLADVWAPVLGVIAVADDDAGQPHRAAAAQHRAPAGRTPRSRPPATSCCRSGWCSRAMGRAQRAPRSQAVLIYLLAYSVMNIGAFAVVTAVTRRHPTRQLADYAGLGYALRPRSRSR